MERMSLLLDLNETRKNVAELRVLTSLMYNDIVLSVADNDTFPLTERSIDTADRISILIERLAKELRV